MLLTFELDPQGDEIEVFCDRQGLQLLIKELVRLERVGGHIHLAADSWGGHELTEEKQVDSNTLLKQVTIALRPDGVIEKP